jgi:ubiquinone/menaquinone biosynthesis C-methylase UbiE
VPEIESEYDLHDAAVVSAIDDLPLWSAPFGLALLDAVEMRRGMRVLDVGSGSGFPIVDLSQRLGSSCRVWGLDPWAAGLERVRHKLHTWGIDNVEIVEGFAEQMPFEDGFFDLVVSNNGTNNVDDEAATFAEIARVAAPGAQFVFTVNLPDTMVEFYDVYREVLRERGADDAITRLEGHIVHKRKPLDHVRRTVESAGFDVRGVREGEFSFRYADGTAMLGHFQIRLGFSAPWKSIPDPGETDEVFGAVEEKLNVLAARQGGLRMTVPWICVDSRKSPHL